MEITAKDYGKIMKETVEPFLADRREEGNLTTADGMLLHYERYVNPDAIGGIVVSHGFTESAEKFREVSYRMYAEGYSVFAIDHRGHAYSGRQINNEILTHVDRFDRYVDDLDRFIEGAVKPVNGKKPLFIYGHSMGGAIAARYLEEHPGVFRKAVLTAPMIMAATGDLPHWTGPVISNLGCFAGRAKKGVPMLYPKKFNEDEAFETSCDTCRERFDYYKRKRIENVKLRNSAPTFSWVREAMRVTKKLLDPQRAAKIDCPVLLFQAAMDNMVVPSAQNRFVSLLKNGELVRMENSKHEIYMSTDDVLKDYYNRLFAFLRAE